MQKTLKTAGGGKGTPLRGEMRGKPLTKTEERMRDHLLSSDLSVDDISVLMRLSIYTARYYSRIVFEKMGVNGRVGLMFWEIKRLRELLDKVTVGLADHE